MSRPTDWGGWVREIVERTERALEALLPSGREMPSDLHQAMRHATLEGGKRVRPLLVHAAGALVDARAGALDSASCAIELIHAYSLVHDDLPCMDDDVLRRGKPTVHVAFGEAVATLAGDGLQALAFESLARLAGAGLPQADAPIRMVGLLARASGSLGMVGGQALDLAATGQRQSAQALERMHRMKTGALLEASVQLGLSCGNALEAGQAGLLAEYGSAIGLAFQVVDDILDVQADSAALGKTAGKDEQQGKSTYVSELGLARAQALARELRERARQALLPFGERALRLDQLADLIVSRQS